VATYENILITRDFLDHNPNAYYIFPENLQREGTELSTQLRDHPHALGFIVKKFSDTDEDSFYKPEEYSAIFF